MRELFLYYCRWCMIVQARIEKIEDVGYQHKDVCPHCHHSSCLIPLAIDFEKKKFFAVTP